MGQPGEGIPVAPLGTVRSEGQAWGSPAAGLCNPLGCELRGLGQCLRLGTQCSVSAYRLEETAT